MAQPQQYGRPAGQQPYGYGAPPQGFPSRNFYSPQPGMYFSHGGKFGF